MRKGPLITPANKFFVKKEMINRKTKTKFRKNEAIEELLSSEDSDENESSM